MGLCVLCMAFQDAAGKEGVKACPSVRRTGGLVPGRPQCLCHPSASSEAGPTEGSFLARRTYVVM